VKELYQPSLFSHYVDVLGDLFASSRLHKSSHFVAQLVASKEASNNVKHH
jgi:hypothetical protein